MADLADVRATLEGRMTAHQADLEALVRIPSVSAAGFDAAAVRRSAKAVRDLLTARGLEGARVLEVDDAHPAVYAEHLHAEERSAPTVLLYAHHDVQPPGSAEAWRTPAFDPTVRDGRLFGRGAADDKAGILVHVAAVDAWLRARGALPVNVKVIVEGEEETGSPHLGSFVEHYRELLRADVIVITDSVNWKTDVPAITYLLRGLVDAEIEVRGLDHALHSGMYGGPVQDPVTGLVKILAAMTDSTGAVAVPGFRDDVRAPTDQERGRLEALDFDVDAFRREAGVLEGTQLRPGGHPLEQLWIQPNITITGFDAPATAVASNTIVPRASAKISARLAPGQDAHRVRALLCDWLRAQAPWGMQTTVTPGAAASAFVADPTGPAFSALSRALSAAFEREPVLLGVGGTIPFVEAFADAFDAPVLLTGVEDPDSRAHGIDESLHLEMWRKACLAEAYLFAELTA